MGVTTKYAWPYPDLANTADGPAAFQALANAIEATVSDITTTSYTPTWSTVNGSTPPSAAATRSGLYRRIEGWVHFQAWITFNASTAGGSGPLSVGLPLAANAGVTPQLVSCLLITPAASSNWTGLAFIDATKTYCRPFFPVESDRADSLAWCSANHPLSGTPIPNIPGQFSVQNGGQIICQGSYLSV